MTKRARLLASITRKQASVDNLHSQVQDLERDINERFASIAPLVSPVSVGDRLLFERMKSGDGIGSERYQAECWEVREIGARTHGRYDVPSDQIELHWTAILVRILRGGGRGKGPPRRLCCKEGWMSVPNLYSEFKLGDPPTV